MRRPLWKRFKRDERGVTAVEFALLAIPFFALVGAILETALIFLASQILDTAVDNSVRLVRTGQVQSAGFNADDFRAQICDRLYGMFDCPQLRISVDVISDFGSATTTLPIDADTGDWDFTEQYDAGTGSQIVKVEAYYKWPTILDFGGFNMSNAGEGYRLLGALRVFRNEPFSSAT